MKMKKLLTVLAAAMLGATALSGCTAGETKLEFKNNWLKNHLNPQESLSETLTYDVTFEKSAGIDTLSYDFGYENGVYTTKLTQRSDNTFEYTTKLTIDVVYSLGGETKTLQDIVESYVHFENASNGLTPIKSTKTILSHSPKKLTGSLSVVDDCYATEHCSMETNYADGKGVCTLQDLIIPDGAEQPAEPVTFNFSMGKKLSFLDNEQLLLALRAFDSSTTSGSVQTYTPFEKSRKFSLSFNSEKKSAELKITDNGVTNEKRLFEYRVATLKLKASNSTPEKTAWVATEDRNVILRLETPLPFSYGKMIYSLTTIERTES